MDEVFPFLPDDFDERYYQAAPADQQCNYLQGEEAVELFNLTEQGQTSFLIPRVELPVVYFKQQADDVHAVAVADTLTIEPERGTFSLVWRNSEVLERDIFEITEVLVGKQSRAWWRARELGKKHFSSLAEAVLYDEEEDNDE